jgi:modification methylase
MQSTFHRLINGDARDLFFIEDESVHLVVTSPPYWNLKRYHENPDQLGHIQDYEAFLEELEKVWRHVFRILVPGGRLVCVVGDVCVARRSFGRHLVFPLHADICVICRRIGFDNLNPIVWHKIANASYEVPSGSKFLGKPYEPNAIIKNDMECSRLLEIPCLTRSAVQGQPWLQPFERTETASGSKLNRIIVDWPRVI